MGTAAQHINREVHADVGYAHLDISRAELVVWPRGRPAGAAQDGADDASGSGSSGSGSGDAAAEAGSSSGVVVGSGAAAAAASAAAESGGAEAQQEYLPEYLRGAGSAGTATAAPRSGGRGKKAALAHINSHVVALSEHWWHGGARGADALAVTRRR